jgi:hypothetical protein
MIVRFVDIGGIVDHHCLELEAKLYSKGHVNSHLL